MREYRRTGRTQRMLEAAVDEAREGQYVMVAVADASQVEHLYDRLMGFDGAEPTNRENGKVYFPDGGSVSVVVPDERFDWCSGRVIGVHPSVCVFADHHAVERQMGWALEQWATWSAVPKKKEKDSTPARSTGG